MSARRRDEAAALLAWGLLCIAGGCRTPASADAPPASTAAAQPTASAATTSGSDPRSTVPTTPPPPLAATVMAEVSADRIATDIATLAAFGTRHTLSADAPDRGIAAARGYIEAQLRAAVDPQRDGPPLAVTLDAHAIEPDGRRIDRPVTLVNVVATLPGTLPQAAERHVYVTGHYDSRASDPMDRESLAPGANDDGSGTALTMELARVLARHRLDATVVFMTTAGEEQGLVGARRHAAAARAEGRVIAGVLNNDIVGDPSGPDGQRHAEHVRLFSSGVSLAASGEAVLGLRGHGALADGASRQLARYVADVAAWEGTAVRPTLVFRPDRFLRGGDHLAFDEQGYPAVRMTEVAENYDRQHQDLRTEDGRVYGDTPDHVDPDYVAGVARLNAAALIHLANAPAVPTDAVVVATTLTTDTTVRWQANPEPDLQGYEVVWRATTSPTWTHVRDVGEATEITLPLHKDDWIFGVRAYDREGYRSPVTACGVLR